MKIFTNNQANISLIKDLVHHNKTKHIDICHHYVKKKVIGEKVAYEYCAMSDVSTYLLTKALHGPKHIQCVQLLVLQEIWPWKKVGIWLTLAIRLLILSYLPHTKWRDLHSSFRPRASFNPSNADLSFSTINLPQNEILSYLFFTILWYPQSEPTSTNAPWRMNGKWSKNKFFWVLVF